MSLDEDFSHLPVFGSMAPPTLDMDDMDIVSDAMHQPDEEGSPGERDKDREESPDGIAVEDAFFAPA